MATQSPRQAAVTVVFGSHAEQMDRTFSSFARTSFLELHCIVVGNQLPEKRVDGVNYHLRSPDPAFVNSIRDVDYRRWQFIDELDIDFALVVDGVDALCLRDLPEIPALLKGNMLAAVSEHPGGRYLDEGIYCGNFLNAGVTFWDVARSRELRMEVIQRGRTCYRNDVDDQLALNEVVNARYLHQLTLLPYVYNFRAYLNKRVRGWPTCRNFNGVMIYHNDECLRALEHPPTSEHPDLPALVPDPGPMPKWKQIFRRLVQRTKPHVIR